MKIEIESRDIEAIALRVTELVRPLFSNGGRNEEKDHVFDVKGLAEYLRVKESWVYQQIHAHSIPYFKVGKYPRFKKREIDRWMESKAVRPIPALKVIKTRRMAT
jgi:excisionase family DNA binding protein